MIVDEATPERIAVRSTCKLNLFLEIIQKRDDGYHDIETLFQEIDLTDSIVIKKRAERGVAFICNIKDLAPPGKNLVERAAEAFFNETGVEAGVEITLEKRIPAGAGVGGGSANATATLAALNRLFERKLPPAILQKIACSLGADCPFFVHGGAAIGRGRGEILEPVSMPRRAFLLVIPPVALSTAAVYNRISPTLARRGSAKPLRLDDLRSADLSKFNDAFYNCLETAAYEERPQLQIIKNAFVAAGIHDLHLTGSGSGTFIARETLQKARDAAESFRRVLRFGPSVSAEEARLLANTQLFAVESLGSRVNNS